MRYGVQALIPQYVFGLRADGSYGTVRKWTAGRIIKPRVVVLHRMEGTLEGSDDWLRKAHSGSSSTHFGIGTWDGTVQIRQWVATENTAYGWAANPTDVPTSYALNILGDLMYRLSWWPYYASRLDQNYAAIHVEIQGWAIQPWNDDYTVPLRNLLSAIKAAHGPLRLLAHTDESSKPCPGVEHIPWTLFGGRAGIIYSTPPTPAPDELPVKFALFDPPLKARIKAGSDILATPDGTLITRTTRLTDPIVFVGWTRNKAGKAMWIYRIEDRDTADPLDGRFGYVLASQGVPHERGMWVPA